MIAKLNVSNPSLKADFNGEWEFCFKVDKESIFAAQNTILALKNNQKALQIALDYKKKKRTIDQNSLLWELLTIYSKTLNGGRKSAENTTEELYYSMLNKYGKDTLLLVPEGAERMLTKVYKKVYLIDKQMIENKMYSKCRCVIGSSNYNTQEMTDLIDGVLDEMAKAGIETEEKIFLEKEWRQYEKQIQKR